ncbi:unnamed protein product [Arabis nemorensis]|uniref:Uncharacterized protein n=1 Tax=Arabis nemorensis TaxID=586526 RepID=A0A565C0R0_9BRAS|nr:unnamed protein product [Arabis nemorensis]
MWYEFEDPLKYFMSSQCLTTIIQWLTPAISLPSVHASSKAIGIFRATWCAIRIKRILLFTISSPTECVLVTDTMMSIALLAAALASIVNVFGTGDQTIMTVGGFGVAASVFASKNILETT